LIENGHFKIIKKPTLTLNSLKAKGISQAAREANLNMETMYRMLSEKGNPTLRKDELKKT